MPKGPFETRSPAQRAVLVLVHEDPAEDAYEEEELSALCRAAGVIPAAIVCQRVDKPSTATYIGKGKVEELFATVRDARADVAVFDCELAGVHHRNLTDELKCRVIDRTQLILDIFAQRAHSKEGKLQVELAQLTYMLPKLMGVYTEFERQKGGIGMRGPGETKLEADRRRIKDRITHLKRDLEEVSKARHQQRASRRKHPFPFACIVGYTSAGKSTLMNALSGSEVHVDSMLFATLDPTTRKVGLPDGYSVFITDTVGFVRKLPTQLVAAFRATLEEVSESDFLIHVVDVSHRNWEAQRDAVQETLKELRAEAKPVLTVFNKIDKAEPSPRPSPRGTGSYGKRERGRLEPELLREVVAAHSNSVAVSALKRVGMDALREAITRMIRSLLRPVEVLLPYSHSGLVQECYDFGRVLQVDHREDGIYIRAELVSDMAERLKPFVVTSDV